jgi:hypothetical protein
MTVADGVSEAQARAI